MLRINSPCRNLLGAPAKPAWRFASLLARSLAGVPISACGGKLRVIASVEEPALIAKILGHVRAHSEKTVQAARAPPVLQAQGTKLV